MTWCYRVVRRKFEGFEDAYAIHEWYAGDGVGSITNNPIFPRGDSPEEVKKDLLLMMKAFDKPPLNYEDFGGKHEST